MKNTKRNNNCEIRIIAGELRGRKISVPIDDNNIRPTKSLMRQAGFDMLTSRTTINGANVVDICCGSGSLGIEALSRGANHVTFVDTNTKAVTSNLRNLGIDKTRYKVITGDASKMKNGPFDIILSDPPYETLIPARLINQHAVVAHPKSLWLIETENHNQAEGLTRDQQIFIDKLEQAKLEVLKQKTQGKSTLWLIGKNI